MQRMERNSRKESMAVSWSELHADMLSLILTKLSLLDAIHFGAVCVEWNMLFKSQKHYTQWPPWLILPATFYNNVEMYSMVQKKHYKISLTNRPKLRFKDCIGSSHGWLIIADEQCKVQLLNPVTGIRFRLPLITTLPSVHAIRNRHGRVRCFDFLSNMFSEPSPLQLLPQDMQYRFFRKSALSLSSKITSCQGEDFTVMMIHDGVNNLSFARPGDRTWTTLESADGDDFFSDIIFHKGKFHTLRSSGMVEVWDWDAGTQSFKSSILAVSFYEYGTPEFFNFVDENPEFFGVGNNRTLERFSRRMCYKHLVESADGNHLMLILRLWNMETVSATIFKIVLWDEQKLKWVQLKSLGCQALFLGNKQQPLCLRTDSVPELQPNCIYFSLGHDSGVYCMESKEVKPIAGLLRRYHWRRKRALALWFTPSLD